MNDNALERIRLDISQGRFPSRKLPSFNNLSKLYDVSFTKIRSIVQQLSQEGLVEVKSRSGVYILVGREPSRIGLLLAEGARWYVGALLGGVASACFKRDWDLIVVEAGDAEREERCLGHLLDRTDVVLYVPRREGQTEAARALLRENHKRIVFVDRRPEPGEYDIPVVSADNLSGGRMAAEYFLGLGPKKLKRLFLISELEGSAVRERIESFRVRLLEAEREPTTLGERSALTLDPAYVYKSSFTGALAGYDAFQHFDRANIEFGGNDGIFATTDAAACGFRQAVSDIKKKNPSGYLTADEVQMLGFDGEDFLSLMQDRFPSIVQDFRLIGRKAVEVAQRRLGGKSIEAVSRIAVRINDKGSPSYARRELAAARQLEWVKGHEVNLLAELLRHAPLYVRLAHGAANRELPANVERFEPYLRGFELGRFKPENSGASELWLPHMLPEGSAGSSVLEERLAAFLHIRALKPDDDLALSFFRLPLRIAFSVKGRTDKLLWANPEALRLVGAASLASAQGLPPGDIWAADDAAVIAQQDSLLLEQPSGHAGGSVKVAWPKLAAYAEAEQIGGTNAQRISVRFLFRCLVREDDEEAKELENLMLGVISYWLEDFEAVTRL